MSLSGVRDLSLILTAPFERLAVRSYVAKFDEITIKEAEEDLMHHFLYSQPTPKQNPFLRFINRAGWAFVIFVIILALLG